MIKSYNYWKRASLKHQYMALALVVFSVTIIFSSWMVWVNYNKISEEKNFILEKTSVTISDTFDEIIKSTEGFLNFVGKKIQLSNDFSSPNIAFILSQPREDDREELFSWSSVDFVIPDGRVIADSRSGLYTKDLFVTSQQREWFDKASDVTWRPHFSAPDIGMVSGRKVIPIGYGITDKSGKFKGYLSLGIDVEKLNRRLEAMLPKYTHYILLTKDYKIVSGANTSLVKIPENITKQVDLLLKERNAGSFSGNGLYLEDQVYRYYRSLHPYPYIVLIGHTEKFGKFSFEQIILPQIVRNVLIGVMFAVVIIYLSYRVVKPIISLSDMAKRISSGEYQPLDKVVKKQFVSYELRNLALQMLNIERYASKLKKREKELSELNIKLTAAINEANTSKEASEAKSNFLAHMSHELRTPLLTINGYSELITEGVYGRAQQKIHESAESINLAGNHLLQLINQILDLSKIEAGKFELDEQVANIKKDIVDPSIQFTQKLADHNKVTIKVKASNNLPKMRCDVLRMRQILINLLSNAIKFSNEGGKVILDISVVGESIVFKIIDNGIGVAKEEIPLILSEFGQAKINALKRNQNQGTGLGLPMVISLVEQHGGKFNFDSELNKGTIVTIVLPRDRLII